uniref:Transcription elongation factor n=1 Tax=Parascaris univalens TaxID=6257 RepID=A0A915AGL8_PARUN
MRFSKIEMRNKCIQMLLNALQSKELPDGTHDPEELAVKIEKKLFEVHRGTGDKYRSAVRSRVFNLRDKKNAALRENVLTGVVTPAKFAVMTSEEMASDEMRSQREKFTKQAIEEHQMSVQEGTPSDMFKCGKCGKKNCTYTQVQTRSADEPMTTFVFCRECGNRWKFC